MATLKLFDTIANIKPIPAQRLTLVEPEYQYMQELPIGQVGTIVEIFKLTSCTKTQKPEIACAERTQFRAFGFFFCEGKPTENPVCGLLE